jgi:medium-chain acyl-[acyl-carrier-protein] hydrolase
MTREKPHQFTDDDLFSHVEKIGGLPAGVHPDFLRQALKVIREDYRVFDTYSYTAGPQISSPITSMGGTIDCTVPLASMLPWSEYTSKKHTHVQFGDCLRGDHFFINEQSLRADVLAKVNSICQQQMVSDENKPFNTINYAGFDNANGLL